MVGAVLVTNLIVPRVSPILGASHAVALGSAAMALACLGLLGTGQGNPYIQQVVQFVVLGGGLGLLVPPLTSMLLGSVDKARSGVASGVLNSMRQIGSVLGVALFGSMIATEQLVPGMRISLALSAALLALSALMIIVGVGVKQSQ
jgi:MFS transporter, DHA2 family, methylenomycin A resistance protein